MTTLSSCPPPRKNAAPALAPRFIALVCASNAIGGTERIVLNLARGLAHRGHRIQTFVAGGGPSAATAQWFAREGVDAKIMDSILLPWGKHRLRETCRLCRMFRTLRPEIVSFHYPVASAHTLHNLAARWGGAKRIVCSLHHPVPWNPRRIDRKLRVRLAAATADALTVDTPQQEALQREAVGKKTRIQVLPPGADTFEPTAPREQLRERWQLPRDAVVIASLARHVLDKGFPELIDAVATLALERPHLRLLIGGDGPDGPEIRSLAKARLGDRALFTGRIPNPGDIYEAADLFALPSRTEGFGLVYIEAALRGIPGIGLRIEGVPFSIADGQTGLLAEPRDPASLRKALATLVDNASLRLEMGRAARCRALESFTVERMIDQYELLLCGAL